MHDKIYTVTAEDPRHVLAYIGGSEIDGEIGTPACIPQLGAKGASYIGTNKVSTVYAAELRGLHITLEHAIRAAVIIRKITIFTDNQATIQAVARPTNKSGQYLV